MSKKFSYPVQMASIRENDWRMQKFLNKGYGLARLMLETGKLRLKIEIRLRTAPPPPKTCKFFPGSKLIGYGWEWAIYGLPGKKKVVKIPAGVFLEVNESEYLENTKFAYEVCKKFLGQFVVESTFERRKGINMIFQRKLLGKEHFKIDIRKISLKHRESLIFLSERLLKMLEKHQWIPDMNLEKKGKVWNIWNCMFEKEEPRIFDFTYYHDPFRLYPGRTKWEIKKKGGNWRKFLKELSS